MSAFLPSVVQSFLQIIVRITAFLVAEPYSVVWLEHMLSVHSSVDHALLSLV